MSDASVISTINVDSPSEILSDAPTRVNILSTKPILALSAGTKHPICAISTTRAVWRSRADFPAMFGPVMIIICCFSLSSNMSLGTYLSPTGNCISMTGCRACLRSITSDESTTGLTYLCSSDVFAKPSKTSR